MASPGSAKCRWDLESLLALFTRLKVPVAAEKVEGPSTHLTFLGIVIDTSSMSLRLPSEKLCSLKSMVADWLHKKSCRIQDLQSLLGKLQHACKVIWPGRTFLRRMFELLKGRPRGQQFVFLGNPFRSDLRWWHMFLESWNGTGLLQGKRLGPADFNLFTDTSGSFRGVSNAAKSRTRLRNLCNFTKITPGLHPDYTGITYVCNSYLTHICNLICICNSYL